MKKRGALWGGRFSEDPAPLLQRINDSLAFDRELFPEEVRASSAWADALVGAGVLTRRDATRIRRALAAMPAPDGSEDLEDVHSYVEARLTRKLGGLGSRLHCGRSRNDQVATDLKLYLKSALGDARTALLLLAQSLAGIAALESGTPMPAYTHLRRAEPVTLGHWCLAYVEMLLRDADRLAWIGEVHDTCPLGAAALAGTPLPVDRGDLARKLGFRGPARNSLDAVSDRDMAVDYLHAAAMLLMHLSRMAEDLIFLSADEVGFLELPDAYATGSSRMPHKKNPDLLELIRGHAARTAGDLMGLLGLLKGLPLAYDKDLQLDKEPVFRTRRLLADLLPALQGLLSGLRLDRGAMRRAAGDDRVLATEVADAMSARGVPFRNAHDAVGKRFAEARRKGVSMSVLGPGGGITGGDLEAMDVDRALGRRAAVGGTAPARVRAAARAALREVKRRGRGSGRRTP